LQSLNIVHNRSSGAPLLRKSKPAPSMATLTNMADLTISARATRIFDRELLPLIDAVYTFAVRLTNDSNKAEDLVQETYLKAWRFMDGYAEGTNARAWLFRICRNAFINEYRNTARTPRKVDYEDIVVYHNEDDPANPRYLHLREEASDRQIGDEIETAINALSPAFKTVILLDLEDFTYEEIAAIVEIPIGTVRSRLHRARNILANKLRGYAESQGYNVQDDEEDNAPAEQESE
jgi:RNA polymerase sigma factor (sigma-70 family)